MNHDASPSPDRQWIPSARPFDPAPPAPRQLGIGVLGLHEGLTLLGAMDRVSHARAVAGCDREPGKLERARGQVPEAFYTDDLDAMLARDDVDVVAIYTPDPQHGEHVERAFAAGKHVICTKPLVVSVEAARRIRRAAAAAGDRRLMVGQSTRFFEPFRRQREAYERGEFGATELVEAHYVHRMDWYYEKSPWVAKETDWVFLGLSHPLDLLTWYLGRIDEVHAYGTQSKVAREYDVVGFDVYSVQCRAADGRLGRAMGHYGVHELPRARNCIELLLYGGDGTSLAQYHDMRYLHTAADGTEVVEDSLYAWRHHYFNSEVHGMHYGEFAAYLEHFCRAILKGTPNHPDLDDGLETFAVMEAVRRSARGGRPVAVDEVRQEIADDGGDA